MWGWPILSLLNWPYDWIVSWIWLDYIWWGSSSVCICCYCGCSSWSKWSRCNHGSNSSTTGGMCSQTLSNWINFELFCFCWAWCDELPCVRIAGWTSCDLVKKLSCEHAVINSKIMLWTRLPKRVMMWWMKDIPDGWWCRGQRGYPWRVMVVWRIRYSWRVVMPLMKRYPADCAKFVTA